MLTENVEALFELSPMQQGMLFHSLYALQSGIYVEQIMCRLTGLLDVPAFERAWEMVIAQHQILRTSFFWQDLERPMQVVHREATLPLIQHDWRGAAANEQRARLETLIQADRKQGFEFSQPPLMRLILVRLTESSYQLIWSSHHILLDGWSQSLVLKEVCNAYQALAGGKEIQLEASRPFADYVNWLQQQDQSEAETFWRETLRGFSAPTTLGIDHAPGSVNHEQRYEETTASLPSGMNAALQSFARKHRLTTYTLVQAAWALLLSRYSGEEDVVFGTTVSVRPPELEGIEATAGLFINTLPVRAQISAHASLLSWLKQLQDQTVEARDFEHTPLVDIQQWSEVPRGQSLFESILVFENYPTDGSLWALGNDLETSDARSIVSRTNYPLTLLAMPGAELTLRLIYDGNRFEGGAVARLLGHLCALLEGMIQGAELKLSDLGMLTSAELHQQLVEWNSTQAAYEDDLCVHQLFQRQATLTPNRIAIQFDDREISYAELDQKANGIARHLRKLGVGPEKLVGIFIDRSIEMVAGLLGILKSGGAYVPLDPAFPRERLAFMIEDAGVGVLLTQRKLVDDLPAHQAQVVCIDDDLDSSALTNDESQPEVSTENLAYVIYTSGSTGRPKGVQIEHRALTNFLYSVRREPGLTTADVLLSVTTLSFDIAALELYLPLITGARLVIAGRETASDGRQLKQLLADCGATVMQATPATWRMLIDAEWTGHKDLKILCGGEALSRESANQLITRCGSLWNMYGPTETTIWSSVHRIETEDGPVSIGKPIANTQMFILDHSLNPLPIGAPGELYIGGDGLARAYLNRAELTAEKFIPDPFNDQPGRRLYRTGDLACYLSNGDIECLGRADDQVKVRGFRIELGEIEAVLAQHPAIRESVVVARAGSNGNQRLVAYFIPRESAPSVREFRSLLSAQLPDYMIPSTFVELEALPLTANGKVNRRALPEPDEARPELETGYVAPRTPIEERLGRIWSEVLQVERVGIHDNFFELGGHSLLATGIVARVGRELKTQLPLRTLFECPTLAQMADAIKKMVAGPKPIEPPPGIESAEFESPWVSLVSVKNNGLLPDPTAVLPEPTLPPITETFFMMAGQVPDHVAISNSEQSCTYQQLARKTESLAREFVEGGLEPGQIVAVTGAPSFGLIAGMLSVLTSGGVLLTLDRNLPVERQQLMLREAGAKWLLYVGEWRAEDEWIRKAPSLVMKHIDADLTEEETGASSPATLPQIRGDDPAYLFFTSGTTGIPKAVLGCHKGLSHFLRWQRDTFQIGPQDRCAQLTALSFDVVLRDIFLPLTSGASLHLPEDSDDISSGRIFDWLDREQISVIHAVPTLAQTWLGSASQAVALKSMRWVFFAGEPLTDSLVRRWREAFPGSGKIVNLYGPTETTLAKCFYVVPEEPAVGVQPVGRPLPETQALVLNNDHDLCAVGEPGEIAIRTPFRSLGYANAPAENERTFVRNPFSLNDKDLIYKTGDRGRYRADGLLEIRGRLDDQIKIGGVRIEPAEVTAVIAAHASVKACVVVPVKNSQDENALAAYVVTTNSLTTSELLSHLRIRLPAAMVPSYFVALDDLPVTSNGKVDRTALPAPDSDARMPETYVAPRTPFEELLAEIWGNVLNVTRVGINDNLFDLGGNSLLATQIVSRVWQRFNVQLPLRAVFESPTLANMAELIEKSSEATEAFAIPRISTLRRGTAPLSFGQQSFWFLDSLMPDTALYNMFRALRMRGQLNSPALRKALDALMTRHESMRTTFSVIDGTPVQVINEDQTFSLTEIDLRHLGEAARESELRQLMKAVVSRPFDLTQGPLVRATLFRLDAKEHVILLSLHHIVADDWSMSIFARELRELYDGFVAGRPWQPPELPIQYADFAAWQRDWFRNGAISEQLQYWKQQLAGAPALLALPTDRPRPSTPTFRGRHHAMLLPAALQAQLVKMSQREGVSLFMTLLAAFQILLARYSGQDDIVVGSPIAGRTRVETENLIGHFINTLLLRTDLSGDPTFTELLQRVREVALAAYAHQDTPFEKLVEELQPERSLTHTPLFQVMFVFQNAPVSDIDLAGLSISTEELYIDSSPLDLAFEARETPEGIRCLFEYKADLFDDVTITRMGERLQLLLERIAADPDKKISTLPLLNESERSQLLHDWNDTTSESATGQSIHELFEAQVERTPAAVAVIHEKEKLTYAELNKRANHLAHHLRSLGVGPEVLVAICMERSIEMIVGVLGILKAGGAYVPLDPTYPRERLKLMMDDARAPVMLTQQRHLAVLPSSSARMICIDTDWERIAKCGGENPARVTTAGNLAYVIYTSGSTGQPKGVMVQHSSLVNYTENAGIEFGLGHGDRVLQFASLNFDTSAEEIFPCLTRGAKLVLRTDEMLASVAGFLQRCRDWAITVLDLPTAYWHEMVTQIEAENLELPPSWRLVIIGGERALPERLAAWQKRFGSEVRLVNTYGPTEATIVATLWEPTSASDAGALREVPIGKPVQNVRAYVLDGYLQPVPSGVTGELHVGGSGLARGYLNRPELTAEKFIPDPFSPRAGARLYKTGDLARYLPDGNIEYAGRIDHQVKIRGFRVELGEIEAALNQHPCVRESVVVAREDGSGNKRLVAYLVGNDLRRSGAAELREFLAEKLPDFMLPSASVWLDKLPLAPNGKLDRHALPAPGECSEPEEAFVSPQTPAEEMMASIWADILEVKQVGRNENFFELGGHSLLATRMISRVRQALQVELSLRSLFEAPTVRGLAEIVESTWRTKPGPATVSISTVAGDGALPLSFAQQRLWFVERLEPGSFVYNVNRAMRMEGTLDAGALQQALNNIVRRHEILRTNFTEVEGEASQAIAAERSLAVRLIDLSASAEEEREPEAKRLLKQEAELPFDLTKDPLLRVTLLRLKDEEHILLLTLHHIICDGWSMGILCEELNDFYVAALTGKTEAKPELPVQYVDFACWQRQLLTDEVFETQLSYWKRQLQGVPAVIGLPTDRSRPAVQTFRGARESLVIPQKIAAELKSLSRREGVTLFMTLLAAWQSLLHRYTGENDIVIGSPIAGRNCTESENLIGLFVNALALRTDLSGDPTFRELLGRVREVTLGAFANQDLPFEKLVEELQPQRNLSYNPIFQVVFALQNGPTPELKLPGLALSSVEMETTTAKFDLTLDINENDAGLSCSLEYNSDLFDAGRISRILGHFQTMLEGIVSDPAQRISLLPLLTEGERRQLLVEWNDTGTDYPKDECVHELFAAQVKQSPDAVALVFGNRTVTYDELNRRSNQLANYLRRLGVGREALVGICMERSVELMIGLLGIIKAGAAYVPLDAAYPRERISSMLEDMNSTILLTQQGLAGQLPEHEAKVVCLDTDWQTIAAESEENPACNTTPEDLIYVMYTSGSTGKPKGVAVTHRNVVRLVKQTNYAKLDAGEVFLQLAPISFDASTFEIWGSLLNGARLAIMQPGTPSLDELGNAIADYGITTLWLTAGLFHLMVDNRVDDLRRVRQLLAGGDVLSVAHVEKLLTEPGKCRLINGYGPTEGTTFTCFYPVTPNENPGDSVPIGRPIANTTVYLLDAHLQAVPVGVPGEIYIGGDGVARGYFNRADLTREHFIANPFSDQKDARLYKTGDMACYRLDGNIEFLGRSDQQVKLRGFRIELGEVETALSQHPSVQTNVTIAREDAPGDKRLVAYVVGMDKPQIDIGELRSYLKQKLPDYMVPSAFIVLPELPLSSNGKVDRSALPPPGDLRPELEKAFVAPRDDLEGRLTEIWEKVLAVRPLGVRDSFFELGGHSLLAVRLFAHIEKAFGRKLPLAILFQAPTVEHLANAMREQESSRAWSALVPIQPNGSRQPFFGVHAVGGNVLEYHDLARHLGSDQPFYGLQSQGLDGKQAPLTRIEEMAACYIKEVRKLQPEGPYAIGGRSFGGIVAFEMACQLHAQGQEVNLLALFDTYPAGYFKLAPGSSSRRNRIGRFTRRMRCHVQNLRRLPAGDKVGYLARKCQYIPAKLQRIAWENIFSLYKQIARPLPRLLRNIEQLNYTAIHEYVPQSYPGAVTLFLASGDMTAAYDLKEGWQALAADGVEIHEIEGDHINIIKEPFVGELAAKLSACIDAKSRKPSRDLEVAA